MDVCMLEFFQWALNPLGLVLNMVGVTLAFFYGYPQPDLDDSLQLGLGEMPPDWKMPSGEAYGDFKERIAREKTTHLFRSRSGLALMFAGFLLQFLSFVIVN